MAGPHRQHPEHRHRRPQRGDTEAGHDPTGGAHGEEPAGPDAAPDAVRGLSVAQNGYQLEALSAPRRVGQDGTLTFRLTGPDGRPVTDYTTAHDKDLHLIVVRTDGTRFRHVHPTMDGEGTWSLPWRWTVAGSYRVFADFVPAATGETLTLTSTVEVAGTVQPAPLGPDRTRTAVDGFTVTVDGAPVTGGSAELRFTVTRDGTPVPLQPFLGAAGHLVALRTGDLAYLHVHPMDDSAGRSPSDPQVVFTAEAPTPGRYLLYLDFQVDGQVHTATFTTTAR
ncbi:hypothetical protein [Micropruina glycogenica]|uniref:Heavy metal-binding domain-containing protein n=1 Tax=Micropruina glycogenica TaxID=75385 RepID=A0A2N9JEL1_9ACTN|nr:hypothetical protein [Micropruina glycogenica]SPD85915.1 conserved protein of unknown function [Micropruina glycogenica]